MERVYLNKYVDTDTGKLGYIFITKENVSKLLEDIENCFVIDDSDEFLTNLLDCNADQRLIDFLTHNTADNMDNIYDFTQSFLIHYDLLIWHEEYTFEY